MRSQWRMLSRKYALNSYKVDTLGKLEHARLYVGDADIEQEAYELPIGQVAVTVAACYDKQGAGEDAAALIPVTKDRVVLAVADGVGGLPAGRRASKTAVSLLSEQLKTVDADGARPRTAILDGIEATNRTLIKLGTGSATTLVAADIQDHMVRTFHVGDSGAWLIGQQGVIKFQTTPHSPVGFGVEAGLIDADEALEHDELHVITNVIGSSEMRIEMSMPTPIAPRDTLLLASDGLFDNVLPNEIIELIRKGPLDECMQKIWDLAAKRMLGDKDKPSKPDDFSAILFRLN
jgi:serine/threonine protein phosphatase PrpC